MTLLLILGCGVTCEDACAELTACGSLFSDAESCVESCLATERASPSAPVDLACYAAAGCSLEDVDACARGEQTTWEAR